MKKAFCTTRLSDLLTTYIEFQLKYPSKISFIVKSIGSEIYENGKINVNAFPETVSKNWYDLRLTFYPKEI